MENDGKTEKLAGEIITNSRAKFPPSARHCFSTQDPGHLHDSTKWSETAVAQWLRLCAENRKVAGSIPDGVTGIFY